MSDRKPLESLVDAYGLALTELGATHPRLTVYSAAAPEADPFGEFLARFPDRFFRVEGHEPKMIGMAATTAADGRTVFASGPSALVAGRSYSAVRTVSAAGANVKVVATDGGFPAEGTPTTRPMMEDIGLMRDLPGMAVVVPADAPTTQSAVRVLAGASGPAYLRLTGEPLPNIGHDSFQLGRAAVVHSGTDLTIVAVGAFVARALDVAEELGRVGVSVRVLDFASVKPFDEKALLRAARETGAILTMEEHSVLTGVGAL
ncbi:MAG: transketolase family protein, partial [Thermoplasmata archaeon]|nr:transketolase family protein [Thermoplasmata archaeon]